MTKVDEALKISLSLHTVEKEYKIIYYGKEKFISTDQAESQTR